MLRNSIGDNLEIVILDSSTARGNAAADSDVDVLVGLREARDSNRARIDDIAYHHRWDRGFDLLRSLIDRPQSAGRMRAGSLSYPPCLTLRAQSGQMLWVKSASECPATYTSI